MIYTLTLNPALDYVLNVDCFEKGKIMKSKSENVYFGGKGINVSRVLKELGVKSTALGFVGGFTGEALEKGIACDEIATDFVHLSSGNTRINVKIRDGGETDINTLGPKITEEEIGDLFSKLALLKSGDVLVLAGSVPPSLPLDIYEKIMETLKDNGILFVVDAQGDYLLNCLKYKPFLIKPNAEELGEIFDTKIDHKEKTWVYAKKLKEMGAENVLVSLGDKGAVLLDQKGNEHYAPPFSITPKNSVGAGDSMVAGFVAGYLETGELEYALKLGAACGAATAGSEGLAKKEQIYKLLV